MCSRESSGSVKPMMTNSSRLRHLDFCQRSAIARRVAGVDALVDDALGVGGTCRRKEALPVADVVVAVAERW